MPSNPQQDPREPDRGALNEKLGHYVLPDRPEGYAFEDMERLGAASIRRRWLRKLLGLGVLAGLLALMVVFAWPTTKRVSPAADDPGGETQTTSVASGAILLTEPGQPPVAPAPNQTSRSAPASAQVAAKVSEETKKSRYKTVGEDISPEIAARWREMPNNIRHPEIIQPDNAKAAVVSSADQNQPAGLTPRDRTIPIPQVAYFSDGGIPVPQQLTGTGVGVSPTLLPDVSSGREDITKRTSPYRLSTAFGPVYTDLPGQQSGYYGELSVGRKIGRRWFVSAGLGQRTLRLRHQFLSEQAIRLYQPGTVDTIVVDENGQTIRESTTDSVPGIRMTTFSRNDVYRAILIPVRARFESGVGRLRYGVGASLLTTLAQRNQVRRVDATGASRTFGSVRQAKLRVGLEASLGFQVSPRMHLHGSLEVARSVTPWRLPDADTNTSVRTVGAFLGLRYGL